MLFYEWRSNRGGNEQRDQFDSPTTSTAVANELNLLHQKLKETQAKQQAMEVDALKSSDTLETALKPDSVEDTTATDAANNSARNSGPTDDGDSLVRSKSETEIKDIDNSIIKATNLDIVKNKCDIEIKRSSLALLATPPPPPPPLLPPPSSLSSSSSSSASTPVSENLTVVVATKPTALPQSLSKRSAKLLVKTPHRSLLSKELEDWIWQDNRHFLQDKNVFEHTYFKWVLPSDTIRFSAILTIYMFVSALCGKFAAIFLRRCTCCPT
jgi:ubiquitin carboxyl-terminal hydrolase 34